MFKTVKFLFLGLMVTLVFNSCNNKLNILAPYKESISVYAILNPQEQYQFIRVNKIFLGEGNSYEMAQVKDSVNFPTGVLSASLEHLNTSTIINLKDTTITTKAGLFNTSQNYFYTTTKLTAWGDYKLTIKNNSTGKTYTSVTTMVDSVTPASYPPISPPYYPVAYNPSNPSSWYIDYSLPGVKRSVRFLSVRNAKRYSLTLRLHYQDSVLSGSTTTLVPRYVDFDLPNITSKYTGPGQSSDPWPETMLFEFYSSEMYARFYAEIMKTDSPNVLFRKFVKMDFLVYAASKDYYDFLQISAPSTSVVQDKPAYSNISDGFGIFACRSRLHIQKHISVNFVDYMATTNPMCGLRFLKSTGLPNLSNCQ